MSSGESLDLEEELAVDAMTLELFEAKPTSRAKGAVSVLGVATLRSRPLVATRAQFNGERLTDGMTWRPSIDEASTEG
jgi:hypothetical protein